MANVIPISIAPTPNLFHHNNVGLTYVGTFNFKMEPVRSVPLYSMATFTQAPFTLTPTHTITGMKSRPQTSRGTNLVNMYT